MTHKNGPWKINQSKIKYKNSWITIREDQVVHPNGSHGIFGVIKMVPGISVLVLDNKGYCYLVKEFRYAIKKNSVETVGGCINYGENSLKAAKRELKEELGIAAKSWIKLGKINPLTTILQSPTTLYLAQRLSFSNSRPDGSEKITMLKVSFRNAYKMVMKGIITHGPSCVTILKAEKYLNKNSKTINS